MSAGNLRPPTPRSDSKKPEFRHLFVHLSLSGCTPKQHPWIFLLLWARRGVVKSKVCSLLCSCWGSQGLAGAAVAVAVAVSVSCCSGDTGALQKAGVPCSGQLERVGVSASLPRHSCCREGAAPGPGIPPFIGGQEQGQPEGTGSRRGLESPAPRSAMCMSCVSTALAAVSAPTLM